MSVQTRPESIREIQRQKEACADLLEENKLLKAQIQAQMERNGFMEDCIAEMAARIYSV